MIPDTIEQLESSAERTAERLSYDDRAGTMLCADCGKRFPIDELQPASANPYAAPVCEACLEAIYLPK